MMMVDDIVMTSSAAPPQLSVSDSTLKEFYDASIEDAKLAAKKAMVVSLMVNCRAI